MNNSTKELCQSEISQPSDLQNNSKHYKNYRHLYQDAKPSCFLESVTDKYKFADLESSLDLQNFSKEHVYIDSDHHDAYILIPLWGEIEHGHGRCLVISEKKSKQIKYIKTLQQGQTVLSVTASYIPMILNEGEHAQNIMELVFYQIIDSGLKEKKPLTDHKVCVANLRYPTLPLKCKIQNIPDGMNNYVPIKIKKCSDDTNLSVYLLNNQHLLVLYPFSPFQIYQYKQNRLVIDGKGKQFNKIALNSFNPDSLLLNYFFIKGFLQVLFQTPQNHIVLIEQKEAVKKLHLKNKSSVAMTGSQIFDEQDGPEQNKIYEADVSFNELHVTNLESLKEGLQLGQHYTEDVKIKNQKVQNKSKYVPQRTSDNKQNQSNDSSRQPKGAMFESDEDPIKKIVVAVSHHIHKKFYVIILRTNNRLDIYNNAVCRKSTYDQIEDVHITNQDIVIKHQNKTAAQYSYIELKKIVFETQEVYEHDHQYLCSKFMPLPDTDFYQTNFIKPYVEVIEKLFLIREFIFIISRFNLRIYDTVKRELVYNQDMKIVESFKFKNQHETFSVYVISEPFLFQLIELNSKGSWEIHKSLNIGGIKDIGKELKPCRYNLKQDKYFENAYMLFHDSKEVLGLYKDKFRLYPIKTDQTFTSYSESFAVINSDEEYLLILANSKEIIIYKWTDDWSEIVARNTISYTSPRYNIFIDSAFIDRQNENQLILICYDCIAYFNIKNEQLTSVQPLLRKDQAIDTILYSSGSYIYANVNNQLQLICNSQLINNNQETKTVPLTPSDENQTDPMILLYDYDSSCKRIIYCYVQKNQFSIFPLLHKNYIIPYAFMYHDISYTMHKTADFRTRFDRNNAQNIQNIEYLTVRRIYDKFYALDHNDQITTWSVVTGKLLKRSPVQLQREKQPDLLPVSFNIKELSKSQPYFKNYRYAFALDRDLDDYKAVIYHRYKFKVKDELSHSMKNMLAMQNYYIFKVISIADDEHIQTLYTFAYDSDDLKQVSKDFKKRMILSEKFIINSSCNMTLVTAQGESSTVTCDVYNVEQHGEEHGMKDNFPETSKLSPFNPSITKYYKISTKFDETTNEEKLSVKIISIEDQKIKKPYFIDKIDNDCEARWKDDQFLCIRFPNGQKITIDTEGDQNDLVTYDQQGKPITQINPKRDMGQYFQLNNVGSRTKSLLQLIRKYQSLFLAKSLRDDDLEDQNVTEGNKYLEFDTIYNKIIQAKAKNKQIRFEFPFTYRLWRQCEDIQLNPNRLLQIKELTQRQLLFIILPNGESLLHKLVFKFPESIKVLYDSVKSDPNFRGKVPFLINFNNTSIVDLCLEHNLKQSLYQLMTCLSETSFQNNEIFIFKCLPELIKANPDTLLQYLDSRLFSMPEFKTLNRGRLIKGLNVTDQYVFSSSSTFININDIRKRVFVSEKDSAIEEINIKLEILSIPKVHVFKKSTEFFKELSEIEDMDIFLSKTIQILILSQWPTVKYYSILKLLVPYIFYMIMFITYSFNIFVDYDKEGKNELDDKYAYKKDLEQFIFFPTLIVLSLYFLSNEAIQIRKDGSEYFLSGWNYIDSCPPLCILLLVITGYTPFNLEYERILYSIVLVFMWIKFLYFLRIFQSTAYLIRLIIQVLISMKDFLIVLFVTILAFSSGFQMLSGLNKPEKPDDAPILFQGSFLNSFLYTYRMINGDFQLDDQYKNLGDGKPIAWIFFFVCSLFNMIVMMNLLIAIISETFGKVKEKQVNALFNQMACIIAENSHLIPKGYRNQFERPNDLLLLITMVDLVEDSNEVDMAKKVTEFSDILVKNQYALDSIQKQVNLFTTDFYDKLANKMRGSNGDEPAPHQQQAEQLTLQHDQNSKEMGGYSIGNSPRTSVLVPHNSDSVSGEKQSKQQQQQQQQQHQVSPVVVVQKQVNEVQDSIQRYIQMQINEQMSGVQNLGSNDSIQGDLEIFKRSQALLFKQRFEKLEDDVKHRLLDIESDLQRGFQQQSLEINKIYQLLSSRQSIQSEFDNGRSHTEYGEERKMQLTIDRPHGYMNPIQNFKRQSQGVTAFRNSQQQQNSPSVVNNTYDVRRESVNNNAVVYSKYPVSGSSASSYQKRSKTPLIVDSKGKIKSQNK